MDTRCKQNPGGYGQRIAFMKRLIVLCALTHSYYPDITEKIVCGIPTLMLNGNLVHFSAKKKHIGFHPGQTAIDAFSDRFCKMTHTKTYSEPIP